ncbi:MAG TPA: TIGR02757 family protein [Nitrospirae bacterium]|nr:hypothetical protein BMS3Abin06_01413 [bacterium BMS3Abin06]HDH10666.1 TIGR02757 family protein [Nitrospirota bacterium]HDZ01504.1 TIGR02757 family protein [Nitrospirota bacterium]
MLSQNKSLKPEVSLKQILDKFYEEFNFKERLEHDPIEFPLRYSDPDDAEVAGFIAACFAYGKVELFKPVIEKILMPGEKHPAQFFANFRLKKDRKYFKDIRYRFNKEKDILCLVFILGRILQKWGSLKNLFYNFYESGHEDIRNALDGFVDCFLGMDTSDVYGKNIRPQGLTQLIPLPEKKSACKRMNLFLRWMVRTGDIDLGIWDKIPPSKLIIPLDTHIAKISKCLGLTKRSAPDWKTAEEITGALKQFDPVDPLKYDFALCHQGISGACRGEGYSAACSLCIFSGKQKEANEAPFIIKKMVV